MIAIDKRGKNNHPIQKANVPGMLQNNNVNLGKITKPINVIIP